MNENTAIKFVVYLIIMWNKIALFHQMSVFKYIVMPDMYNLIT